MSLPTCLFRVSSPACITPPLHQFPTSEWPPPLYHLSHLHLHHHKQLPSGCKHRPLDNPLSQSAPRSDTRDKSEITRDLTLFYGGSLAYSPWQGLVGWSVVNVKAAGLQFLYHRIVPQEVTCV